MKNPTLAPVRLVHLILSRPRRGDEVVYVPVCSVCGQPIIDLDSGRLIPRSHELMETPPESTRVTDDLSVAVGPDMAAVHLECDPFDRKPWILLKFVFRWHQDWFTQRDD
jgi:hypothetical protein